MGTLRQMRQWLRGDSRTPYGDRIGAPGQVSDPGPEPEPGGSVDTDDWREVAATSGQYSVSLDGGDALLQFGKNAGKCVSELAESDEGRGYLRWMLQNEFVDEILGIVRQNLERTLMSALGRARR